MQALGGPKFNIRVVSWDAGFRALRGHRATGSVTIPGQSHYVATMLVLSIFYSIESTYYTSH